MMSLFQPKQEQRDQQSNQSTDQSINQSIDPEQRYREMREKAPKAQGTAIHYRNVSR